MQLNCDRKSVQMARWRLFELRYLAGRLWGNGSCGTSNDVNMRLERCSTEYGAALAAIDFHGGTGLRWVTCTGRV
jgi:hypothetical protein